MNDALTSAPLRYASSVPRYPISRLLYNLAELLLHPVISLPVIVYLLGGKPSQIVWYAIVGGVATGMAAASGALVAILPNTSRVVMVILLVLQAAGFLMTAFLALGVNSLSNDSALRTGATAYLLLVVPTTMLGRIAEQSHEYRQSTSASLGGVLPAAVGSLLAGLIVWRLFDNGGMGPADLLARLLVSGAIFAAAAAWLASYPTLRALALPHPARPMPTVRSPRIFSNRALMRYSLFQLIRGVSRFADPFLFVGVLTIIELNVVWIGGAVLAFAAGDAIARLIATRAYDGVNVGVIFTVSGFLHAVAFIIVAFAGNVLSSSVVADRSPSEQWQNWAVVAAAAVLGASYLFGRTGHHAYIRSISSPSTRDLSLTVVGVITVITAFSPIIAVRLLDHQDMATLLQFGAGASIISLLTTGLIVPTYAAPRQPRGAWGLRR